MHEKKEIIIRLTEIFEHAVCFWCAVDSHVCASPDIVTLHYTSAHFRPENEARADLRPASAEPNGLSSADSDEEKQDENVEAGIWLTEEELKAPVDVKSRSSAAVVRKLLRRCVEVVIRITIGFHYSNNDWFSLFE